jgi:DNA repair photolyase
MRTLAAKGIRTGALIASIRPGLSDQRAQLRVVIEAIRSTGGRVLGVLPLHLRPGTRENFLGWLENHDSELPARYLKAYRTGSYLDPSYGRWLTGVVRELTR